MTPITLSGYSTADIDRESSNSAWNSLGECEVAELFSLFLEAISLVPFDADVDPLTHYLEITRRPA